jgi:hypothetical protein
MMFWKYAASFHLNSFGQLWSRSNRRQHQSASAKKAPEREREEGSADAVG